jgi:hypothetical protein
MATDDELLQRFMPKLSYDSLEAFFADHPLQLLVNSGTTLRRAPSGGRDGELLATAPSIELAWPKYAGGKDGKDTDVLGIKGRDYRTQYVALRKAHPELKNKLVARAVRDPDSGRLWLQYWLWYIYNDYHLAFNAGLHEGDWEMVQLGMKGEQPDVAVYAQHDQAERRDWSQVRKTDDGRPIVFSARGSHASYFEPGLYSTEAWYDVCDGARSASATELVILHEDSLPGWARWQGYWGDTKAPVKRLFSDSPRGPIKQTEKWLHPGRWADSAGERRRPGRAKEAPPVSVTRAGDRVVVAFDFSGRRGPDQPVALVVNVNSPDVADEPPRTFTFNVQDQCAGKFETAIALRPGAAYEARVAVTTRSGEPSAPLIVPVRPAGTLRTTVLTKIAVVIRPVQEFVTRLFNRRRRDGP